jgi:Protein of unknown function (DUF2795)
MRLPSLEPPQGSAAAPLPAEITARASGNRVSVDSRRAAEVQVLLEGVPLPASKHELVAYARSQDARGAEQLASLLPDREYRSLDEVGEELAPVQPSRSPPEAAVPHEESDEPPGGDAYVDPNAEPGAVRHDAPPSNPPQKALEQQTRTQKEQLERQQEKLGPET